MLRKVFSVRFLILLLALVCFGGVVGCANQKTPDSVGNTTSPEITDAETDTDTGIDTVETGDLYSKAKQIIEAGKDEGTSIIEWYTDSKITYNGSEISKSEGLGQYDSYIDIIVYDKIAWGSY